MASHVLSQAANPRFVTSTEQLDSGAPVISVTGEVDRATAPTLEQALLGVAQDQAGAVILDLTGCSFIDSQGVKVLLAARVHLALSDRPLALVLSDPRLLRIFRIMQVDSLFGIYPSIGAIPHHDNGNATPTLTGMDRRRERASRKPARSRA